MYIPGCVLGLSGVILNFYYKCSNKIKCVCVCARMGVYVFVHLFLFLSNSGNNKCVTLGKWAFVCVTLLTGNYLRTKIRNLWHQVM
jgi:hypothetical protein